VASGNAADALKSAQARTLERLSSLQQHALFSMAAEYYQNPSEQVPNVSDGQSFPNSEGRAWVARLAVGAPLYFLIQCFSQSLFDNLFHEIQYMS
jgi:hypothetical protein